LSRQNGKTGKEGVDQTDLVQHMNNLCAVVNAVMNILPSAAVLPNSISGIANPSEEVFFSVLLLGKTQEQQKICCYAVRFDSL
jgi:hypothetical protein